MNSKKIFSLICTAAVLCMFAAVQPVWSSYEEDQDLKSIWRLSEEEVAAGEEQVVEEEDGYVEEGETMEVEVEEGRDSQGSY